MSWMDIYRERTVTAEQAVATISSGFRVFLTGNCSVPQKVLGAFVARAPELKDVEVVQVLTVGRSDYVAPAMAGHIRVNTLFISDNVRSGRE